MRTYKAGHVAPQALTPRRGHVNARSGNDRYLNHAYPDYRSPCCPWAMRRKRPRLPKSASCASEVREGSPVRIAWRNKHGADEVYVFKDNPELRDRIAALARLN
jgi:hypothetical protein